MNENNKHAVYYMSANGSKEYFTYDHTHHVARTRGGKEVSITEDRLVEFLHTANLLGFRAGRI